MFPGFGLRVPRPPFQQQYEPGMDVTTVVPPEKPDFGFRYPEESAPRPMMEAFRNLIQSPPQRQNPGFLRTLLTSLAAGGAGFTSGAPAGLKFGQDIAEAPYRRATEDYERQLQGAQAGARIEAEGIENKNRFFRDFNETRSRELGAERDYERGQREEERQTDITEHYKKKAALDREEFEARKAGGYFNKYPPKYIAQPGGGGNPKPPTQANMAKAESAVTEEILSRQPQWEKFVRRDPYSKRVTAIVGLGPTPTSADAVQFENFMMTRRALAQRRLKGGFGLPEFHESNAQGPSSGSQTSSGGPDPDYEY